MVRLSGAEHSVIVRLTNGEQIVEPTEGEQAAIDRLIEAGIVLKDDSSSSRFSRRRVMQLSAAGVAAAGLSYLVLPSAAAAASVSPSTTAPATTTTTTAPPPPSTANASVSQDESGLLSVRWALGGSTAFNYDWLVQNSTRTLTLASGTAAANGLVSTAFTVPNDTIVRVRLTAPGPLVANFSVIGPESPPG